MTHDIFNLEHHGLPPNDAMLSPRTVGIGSRESHRLQTGRSRQFPKQISKGNYGESTGSLDFICNISLHIGVEMHIVLGQVGSSIHVYHTCIAYM